jgi:hypothetical protein
MVLGAQRVQTHTLSSPLFLFIRPHAFMVQEVWKYGTLDSKQYSWTNIIILYIFPMIILPAANLGTSAPLYL